MRKRKIMTYSTNLEISWELSTRKFRTAQLNHDKEKIHSEYPNLECTADAGGGENWKASCTS